MIIKNASTMYQFAKAEDEKGGRWSKESQVTDATNPRAYPPASLPNDDTGLEPPLGIDINFVDASEP
jgi:hypothetical protein